MKEGRKAKGKKKRRTIFRTLHVKYQSTTILLKMPTPLFQQAFVEMGMSFGVFKSRRNIDKAIILVSVYL